MLGNNKILLNFGSRHYPIRNVIYRPPSNITLSKVSTTVKPSAINLLLMRGRYVVISLSNSSISSIAHVYAGIHCLITFILWLKADELRVLKEDPKSFSRT